MENVAGWAYLNVGFIDAKDEINIIPAALEENCWPLNEIAKIGFIDSKLQSNF